jgi:hypothetical protein
MVAEATRRFISKRDALNHLRLNGSPIILKDEDTFDWHGATLAAKQPAHPSNSHQTNNLAFASLADIIIIV